MFNFNVKIWFLESFPLFTSIFSFFSTRKLRAKEPGILNANWARISREFFLHRFFIWTRANTTVRATFARLIAVNINLLVFARASFVSRNLAANHRSRDPWNSSLVAPEISTRRWRHDSLPCEFLPRWNSESRRTGRNLGEVWAEWKVRNWPREVSK